MPLLTTRGELPSAPVVFLRAHPSSPTEIEWYHVSWFPPPAPRFHHDRKRGGPMSRAVTMQSKWATLFRMTDISSSVNSAGSNISPCGWRKTRSKCGFIIIPKSNPNCYRMQRHVALKITKSGPRWTKCAVDEIKLYQRVISPSTSPTTSIANPNPPLSPSHTHPGRSHIISLLDHFRHKGPNGIHVCMVFEVLGEDLLGLMQRHGNEGVPMPMVRQIAKQVLLGLDYMHRCCGIIHTGEHASSLD